MWQELVKGIAKNAGKSLLGKMLGGSGVSGNSNTSLMDKSSSRMKNIDNGFYGHMTVEKARKGHDVKIIGMGE